MARWDTEIIDYIEYDGVNTYRIDPEGEIIVDDNVTMSIGNCEKTTLCIELPCYAKDLIEGDIAVVEVNQKPTNYTWYVFDSQRNAPYRLAAVCLTHKGKYWDLSSHFSKDIKVVALLGNAFDSERLTYRVKRYTK